MTQTSLPPALLALPTPLLAHLAPSGVEVVEVRGDLGGDLFPSEQDVVRRALPVRRREFSTGRACAHRALARVGAPPGPLLRDARGAPLWPVGVVGSITHTQDYRAAAVTRLPGVTGLGVDAEPDADLAPGLLERVATAAELSRHARARAQHPGVAWDRVRFSVKESAYKAWYPTARRPLLPQAIDVLLEDEDELVDGVRIGRARARVVDPVTGAVTLLTGSWARAQQLVVSMMIVAEHVATPASEVLPML